MLIYKYTTHTNTILTNGAVKASAAAELNDPFELAPRMNPANFTADKLRTFISDERIITNYWLKDSGGTVPFDLYRKQYMKVLPTRVARVRANIGAGVEAIRANFASIFDHDFRLFCASKRRDSILMWSHYADNHKGSVIGFDAERKPFCPGILREVKYVEERPIFDEGIDVVGTKTNLADVATTKFTDWKYEEEVRALFLADDNAKMTFVPIPPQTFRLVIFGCRSQAADREEIMKILHQPRYAHVEVLQARQSNGDFALEFDTVRPDQDS